MLCALECFLNDCICGKMRYEDFCDEFGYEKIYLQCVKSSEEFELVFPEYDLYDFANELNEYIENYMIKNIELVYKLRD